MKRAFISTSLHRLLGLTVLVLILAACGGSGLDETSPLLTFNGVMVNGVPSAVTTTPTRTLSGTAEAGATIEITIDGADVLAEGITVPSTGDWSSDITLQPGVHLVTVSASDAAGNQGLFSLNMTYDAVSIETYTTPIATDTLTVGGLFDPDLLASLTLTVTLPDDTELDFTSDIVAADDTWSVLLTGLQEGDNVLNASVDVPDPINPPATDPFDVSLTINVNLTDPIASVAFDQNISKVVLPAQVVSGSFDPDSEVVITPLPIESLPITDQGGGVWSATIENLVVGKNQLTASVTDPTSKKTTTTRALLIVEQTPPLLGNISPAEGQDNVATDAVVVVVFNAEMDKATIDKSSFTLDGGAIDATVSYDEATKTATLTPTATLTTGSHTVQLAGTIKDSSGKFLAPLSWNFTVQ